MSLPIKFITASKTFAEVNRQVPAPYIRRTFQLKEKVKKADLLILDFDT